MEWYWFNWEITWNYIINDINFQGATGHIIYDDKGDRVDGLYSFANVVGIQGKVNYFGYFYKTSNGSVKHKLDISKIIFPSYFTERGIIPQSDTLMLDQITTIDEGVSVIMMIFLCVSLMIAIMFIILIIYYKESKVIKAASFRMNIIMCFGAILGFIACILYGIDERQYGNDLYSLKIICNLRLWLLNISYTVMFIPLFLKTYRLSLLFNAILTKKIVNDQRLFCGIIICVSIDIILLTIFTGIQPLSRTYLEGDITEIDSLQCIQYKYGGCSFSENGVRNWSFYVILLFWKICQLIFGLYVTLDVSRIKDSTNQLTSFDETTIQLLSVYITIMILGFAFPVFIFGNTKIPNFHYLIISIPVLLIANCILFLNLGPRIYAVITGKTEKYQLSPVKRIEAKIKKQLVRYSVDNGIIMSNSVVVNGNNHLKTPRSTTDITDTTDYNETSNNLAISPMDTSSDLQIYNSVKSLSFKPETNVTV